MADPAPVTEEELVREQMQQESLRRKRINHRLIAILGVLFPLTSVLIALALSDVSLSEGLTKTIISRLALLGMAILVLEFLITAYFPPHPSSKKTRLKWIIADTYVRHMRESEFNPRINTAKDVTKNVESPT